LLIVCYHNVIAGQPDALDKKCSRISRDQMVKEATKLAADYRPVGLAEILELHAAGRPDPRAVHLTFDDGYQGVFKEAAPILTDLGIPATVFIVTDNVADGRPFRPFHFDELEIAFRLSRLKAVDLTFMGQGKPRLTKAIDRVRAMKAAKRALKTAPEADRRAWHETLLDRLAVDRTEIVSFARQRDKYQPLTKDQLASLLAAGWAVGSHTCSHRSLSHLDAVEVDRELAESRDYLSRTLGLAEPPFAYPYGDEEHIGAQAPRRVRAAGYTCGLTTTPRPIKGGDDLYRLPRLDYGQLVLFRR